MQLRHLSLRLLQVFQAVVRHRSISGAARELHLTQPTVSIQIKKLTEWVGDPLFEVTDAGLEPTLVGLELFKTSQDVFERFQEFDYVLTKARAGQTGTVSLAVVTTAKYIWPQLMAAFSKRYPDIDFQLHIGNRAQILKRFEQAQDDLYLFSHPPSGSQAIAHRLLKNPLLLIAPPMHWACQKPSVQLPELLQERFILREPGSATRLMFESHLSAQGLQLHQTLQIESNEAICASVAAGLGLSVISAHTLQAGQAQVRALPVAGFPLESHWYLVARRDRRRSYASAEFIRFIAAELSQHLDASWAEADWAVHGNESAVNHSLLAAFEIPWLPAT